jgi:hypothetical protein
MLVDFGDETLCPMGAMNLAIGFRHSIPLLQNAVAEVLLQSHLSS